MVLGNCIWCSVLIGYISFICRAYSINVPVFYGHDIIDRPAFMSDNGKHTFLDTNITLTYGLLKTFRLYVHNLAHDTVLNDVKAQIWRPIENEGAFTLVWQKLLKLEERNSTYVVNLSAQEQFQVETADKLGFQCDASVCPVSMAITPLGKTYIRRAQVNSVGKIVDDFKGPIAVVFSIGADILPLSHTPDEPDINQEVDLDEESPQEEQENPVNHNGNQETSHVSPSVADLQGGNNLVNQEEEVFEEHLYTPAQREELLGLAEYVGNNLTLEDEYWVKEGRKIFIDTTFKLHTGILKAITLFTHDIQERIDDKDIYLEIWSRSGVKKTNYKLEWQRRVRLSHGSNRRYEFILPVEDQISVTNKDRLGFSNMDHLCPVTFKYSEDGRTLFRTIKRYEGPPTINEVYHFSEIHEPILFSMGAHIAPHPVMDAKPDWEEVEVPELERFGHAVIPREYMLPNIPKPKAFVDRNVHLVPGYITKFIVFIGNLVRQGTSYPPPLRFQVWKYMGTAGEHDKTHPVYQLKWDKSFHLSSVTASLHGNREEIFIVNEEDRVWVDSDDRIGFISEDKIVPIPYDFNNAIGDPSAIAFVDLMTLNKTEEGDTVYPHIRQDVYHFDPHPHPITWSIEVEIQPVLPSDKR